MAKFFGRFWDRAQGKLDVLRISDKVFDELADKNKRLLGTSSLHVATLMVYKKEKVEGITQDEFRTLIMEWVSKDLRLVFANKAAVAILASPLLAVTAKNAGRKVPRIGGAVEKVPTPLLFAVFSVALMLLQDIRAGKQ
ncbi:hypothetical protein ABZP36_003057 [Zizania latifolia]